MRMTRRFGLAVVWLLVLAACVVLTAGSATANPDTAPVVAPAADPTVFVSYWINGKSVLTKLKSAVLLKMGRFNATVDLANGTITGTITLRPADGTFLGFGFMPVSATTTFTEKGQATGTFTNGVANVTAEIFVGLSATSVNGTKLDAGSTCRTAQPAVIRITGALSLTGTSDFVSLYTIPNFTGCGATENLNQLFDGLVAGQGNELDTRLTFRCSGPTCFRE